MKPFMFPSLLMPGMLHDLLLHGYLVVRNPKWLTGITLGIEDMADAADQFGDDGAVKAGVASMKKLKDSAAKTILNGLKANKSGGKFESDGYWKERFTQLRYFRAMAKMPSPTSSPETLILPPIAFPAYGEGSKADMSGEVAKLGKQVEDNFKRQGFIKEEGHISPVDSSKPGGGNKVGDYSVKSLINKFGGK
jgi:hypothetical protein